MDDWMITKIIYFNIILACTDAAILWCFSRRPTPRNLIVSLLCLALVGVYVAKQFSVPGYSVLTFLCFAVFIYIPIFLAASCFILRRKAPKTAVAALLVGLLCVSVGVDAFFIEPHWLDVSHVTFSSPKIERPLRIVFIADFQTDNISAFEEEFLRRALAEEPDIILFGGDYLQVSRQRRVALLKQANQLMQDVELEAPEGVFAVQGNVDLGVPWQLIFSGRPVTTVHATKSFDVAGIRLTCLSKPDSFNPNFQLRKPYDEQTGADGETSEPFHVVLGHAPDYALGRVPADLLLAGHTHGGQVQLPGLGPIITMSKVPRNWASGITELPHGRRLLVSRGLGMERFVAPRLRFLCRPELVVIDLVPEKQPETTPAE
ncbi:MAG: metallophosphoesterase [Planctomycetota bacterium]|nr:metallophosphoesterase [Planctomycetota bacterium]